MFKFLDGKKTLLGIIVTELPNLIASVQHILVGAGVNTDDYVRVTGAVLAAIGLVHKFLKDGSQ